MISAQDRQRFLQEGYLVVPGVVPRELCQKVIDTICGYLGLDLQEPHSWYQKEHSGHGIIPLHHQQSLWDIRQHPQVHQVFSDLYQDKKLWVTMDRVSYKPPVDRVTDAWNEAPVHWDCDPWSFTELSIQGLVYLTDTESSQGAFCCVPSIFRNLDSYLTSHNEDEMRQKPNVAEDDLVAVDGAAGSLVLFHRLMPHTSLLNKSDQHRFVQYVAMNPMGDEKRRQRRIKEWREKIPPEWAIRQKVAGQQNPEPGEAASLTELGRRLVGVDSWVL